MRYSAILGAVFALASSAWAQTLTPLTSGAAASFTVPRATGLQPICCFSIAVPANATRLEVRASLPSGVQFAIGVKFGSTFSTTTFDADNGGTVGVNPLVVTRQSTPPLRTGTNYIALVAVAPPGGTGTITAMVIAGAPAIELSATALDFGAVTSGQTRDLTFSVRNTGTEALTVSSIASSNAQYRVVTPATPFTVAAAGAQTVSVRFSPAASGSQSGTLTIASNDTARPSVTLTLTGAGGAPSIELSATALDFGTVPSGQNKDLTLQVRNTGSAALMVTSIASSNTQFQAASPATPFTVAAAGAQTVSIRFTPGASSPQSGTLTIASNDAARPNVTVSLAGAGGPPAPPMVTSASAATTVAGPVAPESLVSSFGEGLATAEGVGDPKDPPTSIGGSSLTVKDSAGVERPAQLLLVSPKQINYLVPAGTSPGAATVTVTVDGTVVGAGPLQVDAVAPGLFSANGDGKGVAAAVAQRVGADGSATTEELYQCGPEPGSCVSMPIDPGAETDQVFILLSGTGIRWRSAPEAVTATIGGISAEVLAAAAQTDNPGKDQVVVRLPRAVTGRGEVSVVVTADGKRSNTVTIRVGGPAPPTPAAEDFLPLRTGLAWDYRVSFAAAVALPYTPVVEEPAGLLCSSIFCGSRNWPAGQIEFKLTLNSGLGVRNGAESWGVATTGQAPEFFFGQNFPMEMRARMVSGAPRMVMVANVGASFRIYRPMAHLQANDLGQTDAVTVPAGEFRDAVKTSVTLQGTGSVSGTYTTEVWVAPGVGLVKAVQRDSTGRILYTQELTGRAGF